MGARALQPSRQRASWHRSETRLWSSSTQRPLGFVDPRCTHPPRRKAFVAHPSSLDCFIHDPTPRRRRRRGPPPKSRPNRPHPIPLRTPSPPSTLATYDWNVGDGQLPTLRGGRKVVCTSMDPMPCLHRGASTPRLREDLWWARAPPMRIASAAENHLQAPAVTPQQQQQPEEGSIPETSWIKFVLFTCVSLCLALLSTYIYIYIYIYIYVLK